jgi:hypothetical protein
VKVIEVFYMDNSEIAQDEAFSKGYKNDVLMD